MIRPVSSPRPIDGKYDVLAKIREGGMGALYLVRHRLLNERRVIKVMRAEIAQSSEQQKRFLREAQTATRLKHENIVGFYDFFVDQEGTASMVMEYIEGITLRDMIRTSGPLPIALCARLSSQCLAALGYLHRKGIVHRDISPDNIMLTADEDGILHAKLIDLGIAKITQTDEGLTGTGEFLGKLRYSSPEQLLGGTRAPVDGRSDLFSMGVVIYEMLTGCCPYAAGSLGDILNARLIEPPMPFGETDPGRRISEGLRAVVLHSLQRKPEDRYPSAAEFSAALDALPVAEKAPEDPQEVSQYVSRALQAGPKDADVPVLPDKVFQPGGDSELAPTLTPVSTSVVADDQRPTVVTGRRVREAAPEATPKPATDESVRKRSRVLPLALAAGATLALAAGILVTTAKGRATLSGSPKSPPAATGDSEASSARIQPPETRDPSGASSSMAAASGPAAGAAVSQAPTPAAAPVRASLSPDTAAPPAPQQEKPAAPASGASAERAVAKEEDKKPHPVQEAFNTALKPSAKRPAEPLEKKGRRPVEQRASILPSGEAQVPQPARPKTRFCSQLEETDYKQLIAKEVAPGFAGTAAKVPREDSGLMQIRIAVSPEHPSEDDPTFVSVRFENGGDNPVQIVELRESLSRGGYRTVTNALVPATVLPGGFKELHQYQVDLRGGEPYRKQFIVVDKKSDSWKAGLSLLPCAQ